MAAPRTGIRKSYGWNAIYVSDIQSTAVTIFLILYSVIFSFGLKNNDGGFQILTAIQALILWQICIISYSHMCNTCWYILHSSISRWDCSNVSNDPLITDATVPLIVHYFKFKILILSSKYLGKISYMLLLSNSLICSLWVRKHFFYYPIEMNGSTKWDTR